MRRAVLLVERLIARVAQLDRASASGAEGRGFESRRAHLQADAKIASAFIGGTFTA